MIENNYDSFKDHVKKVARENNIQPRDVQQLYFMELLVQMISESKYQHDFIVKGGCLISNLIGIANRTTNDLDFTLKNQSLTVENVTRIFNEITQGHQVKGFTFKFTGLSPIRKEDIYGGFELRFEIYFKRIREYLFVDLTTGDTITPSALTYDYKCLFNNETIRILSYTIETVLAEKFEAILTKNVLSTRPRDRYDVYILFKTNKDKIDMDTLRQAIINTSTSRKTTEYFLDYKDLLGSIRESDTQRKQWTMYQEKFDYAKDITFEQTCDIIEDVLYQININEELV